MLSCLKHTARGLTIMSRIARFPSLLALGLVLTWVPATQAAPPLSAKDKEKVIGQPVAIQVLPQAIQLSGPRAVQQIVVSGRYADGTVRDLTLFSDVKIEGDVVLVDEDLFLVPKKNGAGTLTVKAGKQKIGRAHV